MKQNMNNIVSLTNIEATAIDNRDREERLAMIGTKSTSVVGLSATGTDATIILSMRHVDNVLM